MVQWFRGSVVQFFDSLQKEIWEFSQMVSFSALGSERVNQSYKDLCEIYLRPVCLGRIEMATNQHKDDVR